MCNSWEEEIYQKPKLCTYVTFKYTFGPEPYVYSYMSRSERSLLAQLRIGVLPLKIETGRYNNVKVEDRICELCDLDIEDEKHFVCSWPIYADIREEILPIPDHTEFNYRYDNLLIFWMKNHWKKLSQFISKAWMVRRHELYN